MGNSSFYKRKKVIQHFECFDDFDTFFDANREIIIKSHTDESIDFYQFLSENADKKISKNQLLEAQTDLQNKTLLEQIPELATKYNLYILSNTTKDLIPFFLKKYDIEKYFTWVVESSKIWYQKPHNEIYEHILKEYKIIPEKSIFFDDKQTFVDKAKNMGIHGILYDDFEMNIEKAVENLEKSLKFDKWNEEKQRIDKKDSTVFFKERDIFFLKAGKNIGFEQNGKWEKFARPFIVIKKFNNNIFWGIPLSTKEKKWKYYHSFLLKNTKQTAILSQFKIIDSKRLLDKIGMIDKENFDIIKQKIKNLL